MSQSQAPVRPLWQGTHYRKQASVTLHGSPTKHEATVVRHEPQTPDFLLFQLEDGRIVMVSECSAYTLSR